MKLEFRIFYRVIPYIGAMTMLIEKNQHITINMIALTFILALSFFKADLQMKQTQNKVMIVLASVEVAALFGLAVFNQQYALIFVTVSLLDCLWISTSKTLYRIIPVGIISLLTTAYDLLNYGEVNYVSYGLFLVALLWAGQTLHNLEIKKENAQNYYDLLRDSEEALRVANKELEAYYETLEEVVVLRERTRISHDLHDSVGHALSTTLIQLQAIHLRLSQEESPYSDHIERLTNFVRESLDKVREVVHDMGNQAKNQKHFSHELAELCRRVEDMTSTKVVLNCKGNEYLNQLEENQVIYKIVQESLTNAVKHGQATQIKVVVFASVDHIIVTIKDNGVGVKNVKEAFGLNGMRERVEKYEGEIAFTSELNDGFMVRASIPKGKIYEITASR